MPDAALTTKLAPFATAVLGGAVGAVLTQAATSLRDRLNRKEEGRFTALTLALQLEAYASACTDPIFTLNNYASSKQTTAEPTGTLPDLPEFSDKTNWRSLGTDQASAVLGFRVRVSNEQRALADSWEMDGKKSAWGDAAISATELGSNALEIARGLRRAFRLGPMPQPDHFDPEAFFAEQLAELKARRESNKAAWDSFFRMQSRQTTGGN